MRIRDIIHDIQQYVYWHYIFPHLDYTKKHFDRIRHPDGSQTFIRKKEEASP